VVFRGQTEDASSVHPTPSSREPEEPTALETAPADPLSSIPPSSRPPSVSPSPREDSTRDTENTAEEVVQATVSEHARNLAALNTPSDSSSARSTASADDLSDDDVPDPVTRKRSGSSLRGFDEDKIKKQRTHVYCFCPSPTGTEVRAVYLVNNDRKRTVIVDLDEGMRMPEMKRAMDSDVESFRRLKCIEPVKMQDVPKGENLVTTRWVLTIKTKEDGSERHKARLVARGFEDYERL
jgi:hypothetical protein